jgi:ATP-dependent Clp protease ATP-binding subunit ClpA
MIAQELEVSLHMAFVAAREKRHTVITVEHLLLALLDNPAVGQALRACGANIEALRQNLTEFVDTLTPVASGERDPDTQPNSGFQRVIQRAILQVQSTPSKEVTSTDVLRALFGEKDCHAELLLRQQHITALDVLNYVSHGITKAPQAQPDRAAEAPSPVASEPHSVPIDRPIQRELEVILHMAFVEARQKRHEFMTVEHLLLALLDNPAAGEILRGCGADMDELRKMLDQHIAEHTPLVAAGREVDTQPTLGFQRVIQRAIVHVQSSGKREVSGANVLVAIFGEKDSHAVFFLHQQGITRLNVVSYLSHGVVSPPSASETAGATDVQVVLYDDDSTPMEFVARVLQEFFGMDKEDAAETMLEIYRDGKAVCGLYSREDGEALVRQVGDLAQANGHPLVCTTAAPKLK